MTGKDLFPVSITIFDLCAERDKEKFEGPAAPVTRTRTGSFAILIDQMRAAALRSNCLEMRGRKR